MLLPVDKSSADSVCSASIISENVPCKVRKENVSQIKISAVRAYFLATVGTRRSITEEGDKRRCDNSWVHALLPQVHTSLTAVK